MLPRLSSEQAQILTPHSWTPVPSAGVQTAPVATGKTAFLLAGLCLSARKMGMSQVLRNVMKKTQNI